jgi:mRNA interferase RelE/StbE
MKYEIILAKGVEDFLDSIPQKHARQIVKKIDLLAQDPTQVPTVQLSGFSHLKRAKSGEYRIIFQIVEDVIEIHILRVGKRNDDEVYKNLESL